MSPPRATYRLQLNKEFTFRDATALVPYLAELGISHVYASPFLQARPGSMHGYDIADHNKLNPEIGTEAEFDALVARLRAHGMGLILDFVPNHMGIGTDNPWWIDVLEWGEYSPYAPFFDIDWDASRADLKGKVLLPVLGDQYGIVLANGDIRLRFDPESGSISAWYYEHRFPISPAQYAELLRPAIVPEDGADEVDRIVDEFARLEHEWQRRWRPGIHAEAAQLKRELAALCAAKPATSAALVEAVDLVNGEKGNRRSWRQLHSILEAQSYRPAYWRVAADEINYRRFFNINELAGLRMELPELFERTHELVFRLIGEGKVQGLRIDHIDGLYDPLGYCERLQARHAELGLGDEPLYTLVEKILASDEDLADWPVAGTTGYEFVNQVGGLFVDPAGKLPLTRAYAELAERETSFGDVLYDSKHRIMRVNLASEMNIIARDFHRLSMSDVRTRDFTLSAMRAALREVIAAFPVYRTYLSRRGASEADRRAVDRAIAAGKRRWTGNDTSIFDFIRRALLGELGGGRGGYNRVDGLRAAMRFQQLSGPVMAKGCEDTAFYRYFRLLSLNEVGGDPREFGVSVEEFHRRSAQRLARWPDALLSTATHDTKRGEDARVRISVVSEIPEAWRERVARWRGLNEHHRHEGDGEPAPQSNDEYLYYQALLGAWPIELAPRDGEGLRALAERVSAFMVKAVREGKEQSSWANPNTDYETALTGFIETTLDPKRAEPFLADFAGFVGDIARRGAVNSLAQILLKLAAPGVPDIYQGAELWDFSLVDPDNRRPVDFDVRRALLERVKAGPRGLQAEWRDGREKLFLIWSVLRLRRAHPDLFARGAYVPLETTGAHSGRLVAFLREHEGRRVLVAAPRLAGAVADWGDTAVRAPAEKWRDVLGGGAVADLRAATLFARFPVAVLLADG